MIVDIYLRHGGKITLEHVKAVSVTRAPDQDKIIKLSWEFKPGARHNIVAVCPTEVVAVISRHVWGDS